MWEYQAVDANNTPTIMRLSEHINVHTAEKVLNGFMNNFQELMS